MDDETKHQGPYCWERSPRDEGRVGTICILLHGHEGPHEFTLFDAIFLRFKDKPVRRARGNWCKTMDHPFPLVDPEEDE
jgi:hypothetical protein